MVVQLLPECREATGRRSTSPTTGLHDPTDMIVMELGEEFEDEEEEEEEVEEEVLEMFDDSIDGIEQSGFRPRCLCSHHVAGRCEKGWSCTFAHGEPDLHPHTLFGAHRGRASAADHGQQVVGAAMPQILGKSGQACGLYHRRVRRVPSIFRRKLLR